MADIGFPIDCPICDRECQVSIDQLLFWTATAATDYEEVSSLPVACAGCGSELWVDIAVLSMWLHNRTPPLPELIPDLAIGTAVEVHNKQHQLDGKTGLIIDKRHLHYRVGLDIGNIWLPQHWIRTQER